MTVTRNGKTSTQMTLFLKRDGGRAVEKKRLVVGEPDHSVADLVEEAVADRLRWRG